MNDCITMAHGSGGESTDALIGEIFHKYFQNPFLDQMEDSTTVPGGARLAMTTDSFVVTPYKFPGGDIGRLCVCGTVNDLLMSGAEPKYLTCGFILEEGLPIRELEQVVGSMAETAKEAGVYIVAGDTKVIENRSGEGGGLMINTAGVGIFADGGKILSPSCIEEGDAVIVSGALGDHHAAILGERMHLQHSIKSDNAPLGEMVKAVLEAGVEVHEMRDVTRGGLATILNEFAKSADKQIVLQQEALPVHAAVASFCGILGLDPLYMGNEGKMVLIVKEQDAARAVDLIRAAKYGEEATVIGTVRAVPDDEKPALLMETEIGGMRIVGPLYGEGLPRIC